MTYADPDRLNRIEDILATVASQQQSNTLAIAAVAGKLDQLTVKLDLLTEDVTSLTDIVMHSIEIVESDRESFQAEIRRIWEYLLQKGGNGSTPPSG